MWYFCNHNRADTKLVCSYHDKHISMRYRIYAICIYIVVYNPTNEKPYVFAAASFINSNDLPNGTKFLLAMLRYINNPYLNLFRKCVWCRLPHPLHVVNNYCRKCTCRWPNLFHAVKQLRDRLLCHIVCTRNNYRCKYV